MSEDRIPLPLTADERRLILSLREIPGSPLRDRVVSVVHELVHLAAEPRCLESQADGVPCGSHQSLCESCTRVFERARAAMNRSFPAPLPTVRLVPV